MYIAIIALVVGFVAGLLVGRKNPKVADTAASEVDKIRNSGA